ncbi:MAG: polysaccharide biosynthesis protein [Candidatus Aureabacteria bacterium]|nr:polysaccharide biosynthesis protein [Candidatus Auribacterota bacterium]
MKKSRVLIIGAGEAGVLIARELKKHPKSILDPVIFIDDDREKQGKVIEDIPVAGTVADIPSRVDEYAIDEILIAIPSATGKQIRRIITFCRYVNVRFRIVPGVLEIIKGDAKYVQIREVNEDDLLGRETIEMKERFDYLQDKVVLITGAGGSIGAELSRQALQYKAKSLVLLGHGENSIFLISHELRKNAGSAGEIHPVIADITDKKKIESVFKAFRPDIVFHSAAHKHVPLMEEFPEEAVKNNILGTLVAARAAARFRTKKFILISSDKAVEPHNVMGLTKRIAEVLVQDLGRKKKTIFSAVRFGNVLGSRGSVVPLFKMQIKQGGPVTVTSPEATRFFMSIKEAAQLVIQAGALSKGGEIFVLDMGEEIRIEELAQNLIVLSGLSMRDDISIDFVGMRPGEKISEKLFSENEKLVATPEEKILKVVSRTENSPEVVRVSQDLIKSALKNDVPGLKSLLEKVKTIV